MIVLKSTFLIPVISHFLAVEKSSGARLTMHTSSKPGMITFVIHGTRGQIQAALRLITTSTSEKVGCTNRDL